MAGSRLRALALAGVLAASAVSAAGCSAGQGAPSDTLNVATVQAWTGLNPHTPEQGTATGLALGNLIYPSAFTIDTDLQPRLNDALLTSAEVTGDLPLQITYRLDPDARWSDGVAVSADDFVYLWQHLNGSDPTIQVAANVGYDLITAVTGSDGGRTVTVDFSSTFGEWQSLFSQILPAHFMKTLGPDADAWNTGLAMPAAPPSANAFRLAGETSGDVIRFERNPEWAGAEPRLDALTVRYVEDASAVLQAISSGELDAAVGLPATRSMLTQADAIGSARTTQVPTPTLQFFAFQFARPLTERQPVREAIATALDPAAIARTIFGDEADRLLTGSHFFAPGARAYREPSDVVAGGDPDAAARLLEAAGWTRDGDGYLTRDGRTLTLTHAVSALDPVDQRVSEIAQAQLREAGIELEIKATPSTTYFSDVLIPGRYDTLTFAYPGTAFPAAFSAALFTCDGGYNFQRYCNPEVDGLFAEAGAALDPADRADLLGRIDAVLWRDLELVPMFAVPTLAVQATRVDGAAEHPMVEWSLAQATTWGLR